MRKEQKEGKKNTLTEILFQKIRNFQDEEKLQKDLQVHRFLETEFHFAQEFVLSSVRKS